MEKILIIGACGQIGRELTETLRKIHGRENIIASDMRRAEDIGQDFQPYLQFNVLDRIQLGSILRNYGITQIYHLAAMLSAKGEKNPQQAWTLNMDGLLHVLDASVECGIKKIFWPSSIAVFGPDAQKINCPQVNSSIPSTVYGISKAAGEHWCQYYHQTYGLDIRSLRFPGLISYKALPGGGTTDYAVDIFHSAVAGETFDCFLKADTFLPMMFMEDAIRATLEIMDAPAEEIRIRTSYNLSAMSFSPEQLYSEIREHFPRFKIRYKPDARQQIADSWPCSVNDTRAMMDWGGIPRYDLAAMTREMIEQLSSAKSLKRPADQAEA
ncbi:NAD-dependent epimerase/dehydratase family protein [Pedobacter jeongneungensis]|uniref:NAD-dependent epimerase/dehydratase family protein n=1 Tax=Pedobacter jeongneungensis TaxID=947309 RepID=A0ABP8BCU7_9SPHI